MIGKKPARIDWAGTMLLNESFLPAILARTAYLFPDSYHIYSVNQTRGNCYWNKKLITVPAWVFREEYQDKRTGYVEHYLAHELAHAFAHHYDSSTESHDPVFYKWFKRLCKKEYQHYELEYKPQNAKAAGIQHTVESLGL